ncbi:hypothetical protein [Aeromonas veronii]|uniref:hypothetical protein n=1 Tax=Aeromonas veronii TaxID=654 RepID=UPI001115D848|nr:hypothetical protein [Aeromonas veronii]
MIIYQLTRPFAYLEIKGVQGKGIFDWWIPIALTLVTVILFKFTGDGELSKIVGKGNLIEGLSNFIQNLPGFYIAALAAISTFNRPEIDHALVSDGKKPYFIVKSVKNNGIKYDDEVKVTRRIFLCFLFSFLTAESFLMIIINKFFDSLAIQGFIFPCIYAAIYLLMFWQLIITTFFGLYYLGNRIHIGD